MIARITESKNRDKDIALARFGAKRDRCTVLIERHLTSASGTIRRIPVLEVTPDGDLRECPAPALKVSIRERFTDQYLNALDMDYTGQAFADATRRMAALVSESRNALAARDHARTARKAKFQGKRPAA